MWMQRQAINNSTFKDECDIGECITEWTRSYITKSALLHNSFKQSIFILFYLSDSYALKQVV